MMDPRFEELLERYASEMRSTKINAERWWQGLLANPRLGTSLSVKERWPFGPASHPWVIATYRKYYFLAAELNSVIDQEQKSHTPEDPGPAAWGEDTTTQSGSGVEPKIFVHDLLAGEKNKDLYDFLAWLVFIPIGMKNNQPC